LCQNVHICYGKTRLSHSFITTIIHYMAEENKKGFGGIFSTLRKIIFVDEPSTESAPQPNTPQAPPSNTPPASVVPPAYTPPPATTHTSGIDLTKSTNLSTKEMVEKIYSLFESINKPGIDFFEYWNAASAMGGATPANLQNAFKALNVLGLTKEKILESGQAYRQELDLRLNEDIKKKLNDRTTLENQLRNERMQLEQQKKDQEDKIKQMTEALDATNKSLSQIGAKYQSQLDSINLKIETGGTALQTVLAEMQAVLDTVKTSVN